MELSRWSNSGGYLVRTSVLSPKNNSDLQAKYQYNNLMMPTILGLIKKENVEALILRQTGGGNYSNCGKRYRSHYEYPKY